MRLQMRGFWRQWHAHMQGFTKANVEDGPFVETESGVASESDASLPVGPGEQ